MAKISLQNAFLNRVRQGHSPVTVFLTNGVKLSGTITYHDEECLSLSRDGITQLLYKHAISTVMPIEEFQVYDIMEVDEK
ncbi:MAG: RNA chaperone Hfq [Alphaproteobacteria bacterium]|nr:RNA chaperone Hfq [Alphaproteobacteria bacterium]MDD9919912.1 RNA chaperone Hfq [Alphaproteobacteria bacterium]